MRTAKGQHWSEVESASYEGESDLQAVLAKSPGLVPVDEIGEATVRASRTGQHGPSVVQR